MVPRRKLSVAFERVKLDLDTPLYWDEHGNVFHDAALRDPSGLQIVRLTTVGEGDV